MQRDSPDDLEEPVHQTTISVKLELLDRSHDELADAVITDAEEWFDGRWDDKYEDWAIEKETTGGTTPNQYAHVFVHAEAEPGTSPQLLGNWANRFTKSELKLNTNKTDK